MYFSVQIFFSVHKSISQYTNLFLSVQIYFSEHKCISQCKNVFLSAQMYFSVHKCISQCLVTWFSRAFLLLGWDVLLLSFALQIDRPQPRIQASSRYPSYQRGLGIECPRRIFPTSLTGGVTSEIAEDDWERGWIGLREYFNSTPESMFCSCCGAQVQISFSFCPSCGGSLKLK